MFQKVLVLSASAGAGHLRAAQAIECALADRHAAHDVRHVDTLEYTTKLFRNLYSKAYLDMVRHAPDLLGWLYDQADRPWQNERLRLAFDKLNTVPFVKMLCDYDPEVVICTHFLPAEIISYLSAKERIGCRQAIVVTDFDVHAMWLCHHFERYFVALDETREHLLRLGIQSEKLTVSGIPIDPVFMERKEKEQMRAKLGLRSEVPTILISAGGFGVGPIEGIMESLLGLKHPAQIVAICGRNEELKKRVDSVAARLPAGGHLSMKGVGYTTDMDEFMTASDILLGKPGGLTTSEALAKGLAFAVVNPIPGQEERNADHLLEQGVAIRCNNRLVLSYKIDRLLDDPVRLASMQQQALKMARPDAAYTVVDTLLSGR